MQEKFVLGFIAGEGSFHARLKKNEHASFGVETSLEFTLLLKDCDEDLLREVANCVGVGRVSRDKPRERIYWKVSSKRDCQKLVEFIEENKGAMFKKSNKHDSYERWKVLLNQVDELSDSIEGKEHFIRESKKINDGGNRGLSADEWVSRLNE